MYIYRSVPDTWQPCIVLWLACWGSVPAAVKSGPGVDRGRLRTLIRQFVVVEVLLLLVCVCVVFACFECTVVQVKEVMLLSHCCVIGHCCAPCCPHWFCLEWARVSALSLCSLCVLSVSVCVCVCSGCCLCVLCVCVLCAIFG